MKSIVFTTEEVRGTLAGNKTQTRRPMKPQPVMDSSGMWSWKDCQWMDGGLGFPASGILDCAPHKPGDILWVRETWNGDWCDHYIYKADGGSAISAGYSEEPKWRPSIHMPREAARLFLRVKDVRVERVQDISFDDCIAEGIPEVHGMRSELRNWYAKTWNACYAAPRPVKYKGIITHYESYPWEDVQETREHNGLPWYVMGNPWVWITEFEQVSKEEAENAKHTD